MFVLFVLTGLVAALAVRWIQSGQGLVDFLGLGLVNSYARLWHRWESNGPAPLPTHGPALLVSNHTCSSDPSFLVAGSKRRVCFLVAAEYFASAPIRAFFAWNRSIPVRRDGMDVRAVRASLQNLKDGLVLCVFPQGGLSSVVPRTPKAGIALIALRSRVPVYPARITGGPQTIAVLPSWVIPSAPRRVHVTYGPPMDLSAYYGRPITRKLLDEVTRRIMRTIAELETKSEIRGLEDSARGCVSAPSPPDTHANALPSSSPLETRAAS